MSEHIKYVDTAVIPLAGLGTRMWPYTAGSPKFMAPVIAGDEARPNIDFTLEDCLAAGIKNIIFITSNDGDKILRKYVGPIDRNIVDRYLSLGKQKELETETARRETLSCINFEYIDQPAGAYGTAVPLQLARDFLRDIKHFAVTGGDDFIWSPSGTSELALQIDSWTRSNAINSIMGKAVQRSEGVKYGILEQNATGALRGIDEKPPIERIPDEPLANISRYILSYGIWPFVEEVMDQNRSLDQPEYYITDVISRALKSGQTFQVHKVNGMYFDAGSPQGLLEASKIMSKYALQ